MSGSYRITAHDIDRSPKASADFVAYGDQSDALELPVTIRPTQSAYSFSLTASAPAASSADTIVVGTTGNHGAAAAAYAAAAGVKCVAITLESVPLTMKVLMQVLGAHVVAVADPPERWEIMRRVVVERGWIPLSGLSDPPVGSNPFGIEG
jgi:hypothetical protein